MWHDMLLGINFRTSDDSVENIENDIYFCSRTRNDKECFQINDISYLKFKKIFTYHKIVEDSKFILNLLYP